MQNERLLWFILEFLFFLQEALSLSGIFSLVGIIGNKHVRLFRILDFLVFTLAAIWPDILVCSSTKLMFLLEDNYFHQ